jgi:hypothetical protein
MFESEVLAELKATRIAIERIAAALESAVNPPAVEPVAAPACTHPPERRIDFGITNNVEDWQCSLCEFRTVPPAGDR